MYVCTHVSTCTTCVYTCTYTLRVYYFTTLLTFHTCTCTYYPYSVLVLVLVCFHTCLMFDLRLSRTTFYQIDTHTHTYITVNMCTQHTVHYLYTVPPHRQQQVPRLGFSVTPPPAITITNDSLKKIGWSNFSQRHGFVPRHTRSMHPPPQ